MANTFSRRDFIRISAVLGVGAGVSATALRKLTQSNRLKSTIERRILMGTSATLELISEDKGYARQVISQTFSAMGSLEAIFSRFQEDSQLSLLNRQGYLNQPHPALVSVLDQAATFSDISGGAFDISVEPLLAYFRECVQSGVTIDPAIVAALHHLVDYRQIDNGPEQIRFIQPGTRLSLDGIAKGYIIDQGAETLRGQGFMNVMVEVGGDLQVAGSALNRSWQIGIQSPRPDMKKRIGVTELSDRAMATSGDYVNTFTPDFSLHHIVDPRSGLSPRQLAGATIIAPNATQADALSTTMMVLGMKAGLDLVESLDNVEALLIGKDMAQGISSGMHLRSA